MMNASNVLDPKSSSREKMTNATYAIIMAYNPNFVKPENWLSEAKESSTTPLPPNNDIEINKEEGKKGKEEEINKNENEENEEKSLNENNDAMEKEKQQQKLSLSKDERRKFRDDYMDELLNLREEYEGILQILIILPDSRITQFFTGETCFLSKENVEWHKEEFAKLSKKHDKEDETLEMRLEDDDVFLKTESDIDEFLTERRKRVKEELVQIVTPLVHEIRERYGRILGDLDRFELEN